MSREIMQQALDWFNWIDRRKHAYSDLGLFESTKAALETELSKPKPLQVRPHEFIAMARKQANMVGTPVVWAEYPTRPERVFVVHDVGCAVNGYGECDCFGGVKT